MSRQTSRRALLKLAAGLPVTLPVFDVMAGGSSQRLAFYPVKNQPGSASVSSGSIVLVDREVTAYTGSGYYLYPDWGQPVVYEVRRSMDKLAFHYPGNDSPLWCMGVNDRRARFSGRVEGLLATVCDDADLARFMAGNEFPLLEVPEQAFT